MVTVGMPRAREVQLDSRHPKKIKSPRDPDVDERREYNHNLAGVIPGLAFIVLVAAIVVWYGGQWLWTHASGIIWPLG